MSDDQKPAKQPSKGERQDEAAAIMKRLLETPYQPPEPPKKPRKDRN
ncbi:MAG: hypothetical protein HY060_16250 [Proteobacteria bacterium]|nr:hypothetical protein [Pseudomonadota bacterium]